MVGKGFVVWLTGLPASGKTAMAEGLEADLRGRGVRVEVLDGDKVRRELSPELGFSKEDRQTHAKRVVYIGKLLSRNGVAVIVALISPYRVIREYAREQSGRFIEVWVKCSLQTCIERDPKGLYKKALSGEITDFTGIQDPYETPQNPEVVVDTEKETVKDGVQRILKEIRDRGWLEHSR
jgi:adenylyl-sulfate kinase